MKIPEIISACVSDHRLPFLVIGGYAVIAYGYSRYTFDLDLLVRQSQREEWLKKMKAFGYSIFRESELFIQLNPPAAGVAVDLMLVRDETFDGIMAEAKEIRFGEVVAQMPSLDHLMALKLHVIKQNLKHRILKDADDLIMLVKKNGLDIRSSKYKELFLKYGNEETYEKIVRATTD